MLTISRRARRRLCHWLPADGGPAPSNHLAPLGAGLRLGVALRRSPPNDVAAQKRSWPYPAHYKFVEIALEQYIGSTAHRLVLLLS
ncbi:hypothetical protein CMQ_1789 [Grosmannia clavigera kw1407]|uniref:Uncharacterized protein n=1 Tax=Grosmannia clavigera (strain kw1407 / UAMH 11150) TaxID=655863 RepID=F0XAY4_GROCL|nr:uncharacterized protein CMQ_1789 [Grosmannia clavigera kw1407]EFX05153.1 hypothetical protein CMQ_1789 [Grosmannia clavigera kw1407]